MAKTAAKVQEPAIDHEAVKKEVADKPIIVLMDPIKLDAYIAALRAEVAENPGDVGTAKGRDIIRANAAEIGKKKSAIDRERLRSTEEWRNNIATVNAAGKVVKETLQALQDETRAPLTIWEEREESRMAEAASIIADMKAAVVIQVGDTAAMLRERLERIRSRNLSDDMFGPQIEEVTDLRDETVAALLTAITRVDQEEADRAELVRLREEREERERQDAARREREEAERAEAERQRLAAEAEAQRQADEAARIERERKEAADRAVREAEERAQAERDRIQREHEARLQAERDRAEEAERLAQEERARAAREKAEREEAARREQEEQARREADRAHRSKIQREVKEAFMSCGVDEDTAKKLVLAILAKTVPHTSIQF
ncbi:hypothetical protein SAMIE_1015230 [Sphingobium amiense]|uniref:Uncharacterized protein n=1 Tax=Sphingobium amiense TaxID=135719 RepID=A0A494WBU6_9SPHN|nr:hypothetical protein [Sphingobium amiense]BBD98022.1 hypothetical protein SAMIE_1015230 [Sphingobium amiense]